MDFLPVTGVMGCNFSRLRSTKTAQRNRFLDLLAARTGGFKVLGGVALYVGSAAFPASIS